MDGHDRRSRLRQRCRLSGPRQASGIRLLRGARIGARRLARGRNATAHLGAHSRRTNVAVTPPVSTRTPAPKDVRGGDPFGKRAFFQPACYEAASEKSESMARAHCITL